METYGHCLHPAYVRSTARLPHGNLPWYACLPCQNRTHFSRRSIKNPLYSPAACGGPISTTAIISVGAVTQWPVYTGDPSTVYWGTYPAGAITVSTILLFGCAFIHTAHHRRHHILIPVEKWINRRYINDARRILRSMPDLTVVGITGSTARRAPSTISPASSARNMTPS